MVNQVNSEGQRAIKLVLLVVLVLALAGGLATLGFKQQAKSPVVAEQGGFEVVTNTIGMQLVKLPGGHFVMGDDVVGRGPAHEVEVHPFYMAAHEVTQAQWQAVMGFNPSQYKDPRRPVENVTWLETQSFLEQLNRNEGTNKYRLPSEAEWEYVARAGSATDFWWGSDNETKCTQANCCLSQTWLKKQTLPVGTFTANHFGVYDTAGNVWEWTASNYSARYNGEELNAADRGQYDSMRVSRGGSWFNFSVDTRSAKRSRNWPQERFSTTGFRVARVVTPEFVKVALANSGPKQ